MNGMAVRVVLQGVVPVVVVPVLRADQVWVKMPAADMGMQVVLVVTVRVGMSEESRVWTVRTVRSSPHLKDVLS